MSIGPSSSSSSTAFQQLVAVPLEQYTQMLSMNNIQQPLGQKLSHLQTELSHPLLAPTTVSGEGNPYDQMMRQGMVLDQVKQIKEQMKDAIMLGTPKPYRNRALTLYNHLVPVTQFNEKGELVLPSAPGDSPNVVAGSRAEDLIQHAVHDRRKQFTPSGWREFLEHLRQHNIPRMMLNRATIDELQSLASSSPLPAAATTTGPSTPAKSKKRGRKSSNSGGITHLKRRPQTDLLGAIALTPTKSGQLRSRSPTRRRKKTKSSRYPSSTFLTNFTSPSTADSE